MTQQEHKELALSKLFQAVEIGYPYAIYAQTAARHGASVEEIDAAIRRGKRASSEAILCEF